MNSRQIGLPLIAVICVGQPANALVLNLNFDASVSTAAQAAANRAAATWESVLADAVTVTVDLSFDSLGANILGSTSSVTLQGGYDTVAGLMFSDNAAEANSEAILNSLPNSSAVSFSFRDTFNGNPIAYGLSGNLSATKANFKALGVTGLDTMFGASDGSFVFSDGFNFDFDNSNGVSAGFFDFESVVLHEVGHLLGFTSVVDSIDAQLDAGATSITGIAPTPMDLLRFDTNNLPTTDSEFTTFARDLSTDDSAALTDTVVVLAMETGVQTGTGQQASHFADNQGLGVMDPTLAPQEIAALTSSDLLVFDLIGWDVVTPVPEASEYALMLSFLSAGVVLRRRQRRA